jgi:hypothetical protein
VIRLAIVPFALLRCLVSMALILPLMVLVECTLILLVLGAGILRPRYGFDLNEWLNQHFPSRDRYWGRSMNVSSRRKVTAERATPT